MTAKMICTGVSEITNTKGEKTAEAIYFSAVYSDDPNHPNYSWAKLTPAATAFFQIENEALWGTHKTGQEFDATFRLAA